MFSGLCESDQNCFRFMDRCMPEAFNKVIFRHSFFFLCSILMRTRLKSCYCSVYTVCVIFGVVNVFK